MTEFNMEAITTIDQLDLLGKRALVRLDLNVPIKDGKIIDPSRIERSAPTLNELLNKGAKVIIVSHFGRPSGKFVPEMSLLPVSHLLSKILNKPVIMAEDCIGASVETLIFNSPDDSLILLENVRFHPGEEKNDMKFASELAKLGDVYVNDAFSCSHRTHASVEKIARLLPAAAGRLMQAELLALTRALENANRPVFAIIGGAKVSTKLAILENLVKKVDQIMIGGAMANTFLQERGIDIGNSLCEPNMRSEVKQILEKAKCHKCKIVLPKDAIVAHQLISGADNQICSIKSIPNSQMILDIGPASIQAYTHDLAGAKTVIWNGPLGAFEHKPFDIGTNAVAREVGRLTSTQGLLSIGGGGDTMSALINAGVKEKFSYVSSAGGAFLEWVEGRELPGVAALKM